MSISKTTLQKMAKQYAQNEIELVIQVGDKDVPIKIRPVLSLVEVGAAAKDMADMQFAKDDYGNDIYVPYLQPFAERYVTVSYFTNLDLTSLQKQSDNGYEAVEPIWQFLMSDVYDKIVAELLGKSGMIESNYWTVQSAAEEYVQMKRKQIEPSAEKLWASLDELVEQAKASFGDMTPEDLEKTREAINKLTSLDEGKIVELMR